MSDISTATSNVIPFDFHGHSVRAVTIDGEPWFVASDVCRVLEVANTSQAMQALDDDERSMFNIGRQGEANIVNESGLYTLILRSRDAVKKGSKPHAFRKWVTAEVLPAIRKQGRYKDSSGKMNTLVGQTIGTDGFHMLGAVVKGKVSSLPTPVQRRATAKIWSQTHAAFGVRSAADIPADQLDAARNFIAAYVVIEGEYIQAKKDGGGIYLDQLETAKLYLLMSRFATMHKHKSRMLAASRALGSAALMDFFDQLHDGHISFSALDKRRDEIYAAYKATGCDGGYMWRGVA